MRGKTSISGILHRAGFALQKRSPEILVAAGIVGFVVSAVMACKATTKLSEILDEAKSDIDQIHEVANDESLKEKYTVEDNRRDLTIVYAQTGVKIVKLYAPSLMMGVLSVTSILASHNILSKRNVALAAAYATVDKSFKDYRGRVVQRFGERVDKELQHNIRAIEVTETITDEKTGEPKEVKKTLDVVEKGVNYSPYARFFDETSANWEKNAEYNLMFLRNAQQYANDKLRANGHLFLNEVYDDLGIPRSKAGQVVGWVYAPDNPKHTGDNYVDFGIYDVYNERARDFVNGYERSILLDFNVDGNILTKIE